MERALAMNQKQTQRTVGLSSERAEELDQLKEKGFINEKLDGYRIGVALALAHGEIAPPTVKRDTTFMNIGSLDPNGELQAAVQALCAQGDEPVYRTVERLAEWGIAELVRLSAGEDVIPIARILTEVQAKLEHVHQAEQ